MAFSISSIFGGAQQQAPAPAAMNQQQTASQPTPGNIPDTAGNTSPNNPTVPQSQQNQTTQQQNQSQSQPQDPNQQAPQDPFAQFSELWKPPVDAKGNPVVDPNSVPVFPNVDPKKIMEIAGKANFAAAIPKDAVAKISAGGQDAVDAFSRSMNAVSQAVFAQATLAATKIAEQAVTRAQEKMQSQMPELIKRHTLSDNLRGENPLFSNPAVQPIISAMESQLARKFPNATASELTSLAKQYVASLGNVLSPAPANTDTNSGKTKETDWSTFL